MMTRQITDPNKTAIIQHVLSYTLIRQLLIIGIVAAVVLLTAWWRYSTQVSQVTPLPTPVLNTPAISPLSPGVAPVTHIQASDQQSPDSTTKTQLKVNGQTVPIPTNGTVEQTIQSPDGTTSVNLSVDATSSGSKSTSSSTHIQMNSSSHSQVVTHETH